MKTRLRNIFRTINATTSTKTISERLNGDLLKKEKLEYGNSSCKMYELFKFLAVLTFNTL